MNDYIDRVIEEKIELDAKLIKLMQFAVKDAVLHISAEERAYLERQMHAMMTYSQILAQRIIAYVENKERTL